MLVELFPASNRSSASAIGFNIALAFIAGPAAYIGTWLAGTTGDPVSPAWYMVLLAVIALPFLWKWLPETAGRDITSEDDAVRRSEEHTSELQSLMRISYAVFCLKKKKQHILKHTKH